MEKTPQLAQVAKQSLEWRGTSGDSRRSWTWPWRAALWARFKDGEKAHDMVEGMIRYNMQPNMLATHPPMQRTGRSVSPAPLPKCWFNRMPAKYPFCLPFPRPGLPDR